MGDGSGQVLPDAGPQLVGQRTQLLQTALLLKPSETNHNALHDARVDGAETIGKLHLHITEENEGMKTNIDLKRRTYLFNMKTFAALHKARSCRVGKRC